MSSSTGMVLFHTINGGVALVAGLAIVLMGKGTRAHRFAGYIYVSAMYVLCFGSFAIRDTTPFFSGLGMFHVMALVSAATVTAGLVPVLFRSRYKDWFASHYQFMLWSYVGLVMAFNSHFFREVYLFLALDLGLGRIAATSVSVVLLWGLPPVIGRSLIKRNSDGFEREFAGNGKVSAAE